MHHHRDASADMIHPLELQTARRRAARSLHEQSLPMQTTRLAVALVTTHPSRLLVRRHAGCVMIRQLAIDHPRAGRDTTRLMETGRRRDARDTTRLSPPQPHPAPPLPLLPLQRRRRD